MKNTSNPRTIFKNLIDKAENQNFSDVHIESTQFGVCIRTRIDGILNKFGEIPISLSQPFITLVKVQANLDISEKRRPQDGKIRYKIEDRVIDIRVSTIPTIYGEKIVLRILDPTAQKTTISDIGLLENQKTLLHSAIKSKRGIMLISGPTGSGKTTTLYSILKELNRQEINIVTIEDPVEYEIEGINQSSVNREIDYSFANALRAFLRQDPDIIFIGEIRDTETAQIAIRAALTGHLVLSSVHTNSALDTIVRLVDMGVEPYLLASTLKMVAAQRLVRKLCPECQNDSAKIVNCTYCNNHGYKGRDGIFEILEITESVKDLINDRANQTRLRKLPEVKEMITLEKAGEQKVQEGVTTSEEVQRVLS